MEQKTDIRKFLQERKYLVVLSLIVLPLVLFLLWYARNQKEHETNGKEQVEKHLNTALPDAVNKTDKGLNKMSYYDKAILDSQKLKELMKNDPYYYKVIAMEKENHSKADTVARKASLINISETNLPGYTGGYPTDPNEAKVYGKLEQLNRALNKATALPERKVEESPAISHATGTNVSSADIQQLEKMMHTMSQKEGEDPEMKQLNTMLEKILDIQHPERLQDTINHIMVESEEQLFSVSPKENTDPIYLLTDDTIRRKNPNVFINSPSNSFYSSDDLLLSEEPNSIEAVIHETQTLVNGSTVKLRLINDTYINTALIPKNTFLFGTAALNGERLSITISGIRYKNSLFPVQLSVVDLDGMDGIYIPGAITRDVAKQSTDRAIQNVGLATLDPSVAAQAASAGIEAAKTLISKKVKLIKVTVKAGYQVLLRDQKQKNKM